MIGFVDPENVAIEISENDDGIRTVTITTNDDCWEYEVREEDSFEVKVTAGMKKHDHDLVEPRIKNVRTHRYHTDKTETLGDKE